MTDSEALILSLQALYDRTLAEYDDPTTEHQYAAKQGIPLQRGVDLYLRLCRIHAQLAGLADRI